MILRRSPGWVRETWPEFPPKDEMARLFRVVDAAVQDPAFPGEGPLLDEVLKYISRLPSNERNARGPFFDEEYYTPAVVADLMVGLAMFPGARTVFIPACGTGELAWSALRLYERAEIQADSIERYGCLLTWVGLTLRGATAAQRFPRTKDRDQMPPERRADITLSNPPSRLTRRNEPTPTESSKQTPRCRWIRLAYDSMAERSRAVVVVPRSAATSVSQTDRELRDHLLEQGVLRVVIDLPKGVFPQANAPMSIWLLERGAGQTEDSDKVLIVDSSRLTDSSNGIRDIRPAMAVTIARAVSEWLDGQAWFTRTVHATVKSAEQIRARGADLSGGPPDRSTLCEVDMASPDTQAAVEIVQKNLGVLNDKCPDPSLLQELGIKNAIFMHKPLHEVCDPQAGPASQIEPSEISEQPSGRSVPLIEPRMVGRNGTIGPAVAWLNKINLDQRYITRYQDILLTRVGDRPRIGLVSEDQKGWIQGRGCLRLRLLPESGIRPEFLMYYLQQQGLTREWLRISDNTASPSISVKAIRDLPVPVLPQHRQDLYINTVRAYNEFADAAEILSVSAGEVVNRLLAGLKPLHQG